MTKRRKLVLGLLCFLVLAVFFAGGAALAISMYQEKVAGLGKWEFTNEVTIDEIEPELVDSQVIVKLKPTVNTIALMGYTVTLTLDDVAAGTPQSVSWAAAEITANTKKTVTFTGVSLGAVIVIEVKVTS